jgi:hypothetical protein
MLRIMCNVQKLYKGEAEALKDKLDEKAVTIGDLEASVKALDIDK